MTPGSRWLSWEGNTPLSNACAGEQTPLVEVLATEKNTLTADHHYELFKLAAGNVPFKNRVEGVVQ
jgi:hypothetical protein